MATPTADQVRAVLGLTIPAAAGQPTDAELDVFVSDAGLIVGQCKGVALLSDDLQCAINKYVAAHLYSQIDGKGGTITQDKLGDASQSFASSATTGIGLKSTRYGLQAIMLDSTGCLENIGRKKAKVCMF